MDVFIGMPVPVPQREYYSNMVSAHFAARRFILQYPALQVDVLIALAA